MAKVTVMEYERVVRFVDGRLAGVLEPGRHTYRRRGTRLDRVDLRPRLVPVNGQEMLTADRLVVKVSATLRLAVADAALFVTAAQDPVQELYLRTQVELRAAVAEAGTAGGRARRHDAGRAHRRVTLTASTGARCHRRPGTTGGAHAAHTGTGSDSPGRGPRPHRCAG